MSAVASTQGRTWTDIEGRQLEASIDGVRDESVFVIRESDSRRLTLPLNRLSDEDRVYAQAWAKFEQDLRRPWPSLVRASGVDVEIDTTYDAGIYRYTSPHFTFQSDAELSTRLVRHIASIFEVVYAAGEEIPLMIEPLPNEQAFSVRLFKSVKDYEAAGGLHGSVGYYSYDRSEVLVPLSSLAVGDDAGVYRPESNPDYPVLIHETFHCVTSEWKDFAPIWLVEGFARYMEVLPHTRDQLNFKGLTPRLAVWKSGGGTYKDVAVLDFEWILNCSYKQWDRTFYDKPTKLHAQYTSALVLVLYFVELDGNQGALFKRYLFELSQGMPREDALQILLDGRSHEELSRDIISAYQRERVSFDILGLE
ncbi:hypothetical protein OAN72_00250 [bacterium]|nr:hypothetical protein [bacterium]